MEDKKPDKKSIPTGPPHRKGHPTPARAFETGRTVLSHKIAQAKEHESRMGRPTLKTPELCAEICRRVAEGGPLKNICRDPNMPAWTTVHDWRHADETFRKELAKAREQQAEAWADEMLSISDDDLPTHEAIGRARLRMQSRQWLAGKYNATYADKPTQIGVNVGVGVVLPETERVKLLERRDRALLASLGDKSGESGREGY